MNLLVMAIPSSSGMFETGEVLISFAGASGEVVNRVSAAEDCARNPGNARLGNGAALEGVAWHEPTADRCEDDSFEQGRVLLVEGTVN
jgi:hypothetical protein